MIDEELLEEYQTRFCKRFGKPGDGYKISYQHIDLDENGLNQDRNLLAEKLIEYGQSVDPENLKQHFGVFASYGMSLAATQLKGNCECITRQDGFKDEAIIRKNLDEFLNIQTDEENQEACISNIVKWCINPESNIEISDDVWKSFIFLPIKIISRTILPGKGPAITVMIPPMAKDIDFPEWRILLSQLKLRNVDIEIVDYGTVFGVEDQERKYVGIYQADGDREFLILSGYERVRGRISCIGSLAFDVSENDKEYEMKTVGTTSFNISWNPDKFIKEEKNEVVSDCHMIEGKFQAGSGFNSFLANHTVSFMREMYKLSGNTSANIEDISNLFTASEALQAVEVCSRLLGEENLYNIALEDVVAVTNRMEQSKEIKKTGVMTKRKTKLGTYKGIAKAVDVNGIRNIPANFATITWKLKDKRKKVVPYTNLAIGKYSDKEIIESIIEYYEPCTTENIAEDILFLVNKSMDIDPSAFFAAKIFMYLLTMDSIVIDSRNEEVKNITNVDTEEYIPITLPKSVIEKNKKVAKTSKKTSSDVFKSSSRIANKTIRIDEIGLSVRSYNYLKRAGINTLDDLAKKTPSEMMKIRNLGRNNLEEILGKMRGYGITLKDGK